MLTSLATPSSSTNRPMSFSSSAYAAACFFGPTNLPKARKAVRVFCSVTSAGLKKSFRNSSRVLAMICLGVFFSAPAFFILATCPFFTAILRMSGAMFTTLPFGLLINSPRSNLFRAAISIAAAAFLGFRGMYPSVLKSRLIASRIASKNLCKIFLASGAFSSISPKAKTINSSARTPMLSWAYASSIATFNFSWMSGGRLSNNLAISTWNLGSPMMKCPSSWLVTKPMSSSLAM